MTTFGVGPRRFMPPLPAVLPARMREVRRCEDGVNYLDAAAGLSVIVSGGVEADGRRWLHVSCARADRLPSWEDLRFIKDVFVGRDRTALQVLPPIQKHVNLNPYCLHLFSCLDGDATPDFTWGSGAL